MTNGGSGRRRPLPPAPTALLAVAALVLGTVPLAATVQAQQSSFYEIESAPATRIPLDDPETIPLGEDSIGVEGRDVGFQFFGEDDGLFWPSSNGFVTFLCRPATAGDQADDPDRIPSTDVPNCGVAAGCWTDLDPTAGGEIRFQEFADLDVQDQAPQPGLVIEYHDVPLNGSTTETASFQLVALANNTLEVRVQHCPNPADDDAAVGIEGPEGELGTELAFADQLPVEDTGWRFVSPNTDVATLDVDARHGLEPTQGGPPFWQVSTRVANVGGGSVDVRVDVCATPEPGPLNTGLGTESFLVAREFATLAPGEQRTLDAIWFEPAAAGSYEFSSLAVIEQGGEDGNPANDEASETAALPLGIAGGSDRGTFSQPCPRGAS